MFQRNEITTGNPIMQHHKYSNENTHTHPKKKLEEKKKKEKNKEQRTSKCYFHINKMYPDG
jgi:hypothetical protein